jgi:divinyl protochlorophyllide a 8-vinyl-reductase
MRTLQAVEESYGPAMAGELHRRAALPSNRWDTLIPEEWFLSLIRELRSLLPSAEADAMLRRAGALTGEYVQENRIPMIFRRLLAALPPRLAVPLLLQAFRRHAWTFAGSGRFRFEGRHPSTLVLEGSPTCRLPGGTDRSGSYYEAAFETLLSLAAPGIRVREVSCQAAGDPACRFELLLPSPPLSRRP